MPITTAITNTTPEVNLTVYAVSIKTSIVLFKSYHSAQQYITSFSSAVSEKITIYPIPVYD